VLGNQAPQVYEAPQPYVFGVPREVSELSDKEDTGNPTLTADKLEIFLTRMDGSARLIWYATRSSPDQPFNTPTKLSITEADDTSPAISGDGLTLWFGSNRDGGKGDMDIWVSTRADRSSPWTAPVNLEALNTKSKDIPRPLGQYDSIMPMSSDRIRSGMYQIYFATHWGPKDFASPTLVAELPPANLSHADAFLTHDGLTLFYSQGPPSKRMDLYVAYRKSLSDSFAQFVPLESINTAKFDDLDPWFSADGKELYFSSDRSGRSLIYVSSVSRVAPSDPSNPSDASVGN
jgi:peptidoglycan-associated lipoprotein